MRKRKSNRKHVFANSMHRDLCMLFFLTALIPTALVTTLLYYLIFGITSHEIAIPETIAYHLIPAAQQVTTILWIALPITITVFLSIAYVLTHKLVGPYERIIRELEHRTHSNDRTPIHIRRSDKLHHLVSLINKLLTQK